MQKGVKEMIKGTERTAAKLNDLFVVLCTSENEKGNTSCGLLSERCILKRRRADNYKKCNCQGDLAFSLGLKDASRYVLTRCIIKVYCYPLPIF